MDLNAFNGGYLVAGLVLGLFGWMCYWLGTAAVGIAVGGGALAMLGWLVGSQMGPDPAVGAQWGTVLGFAAGAVIGLIFMRAATQIMLFAVGAMLGAAIVWRLGAGGLLAAIPGADRGTGLLLITALGSLGAGLAMIKLRRFLIAAVTAVLGATLLALGLPEGWRDWGWIAALVVFLSVQAGLVRRFIADDHFGRGSMHPRYRHGATVVRGHRDEDE